MSQETPPSGLRPPSSLQGEGPRDVNFYPLNSTMTLLLFISCLVLFCPALAMAEGEAQADDMIKVGIGEVKKVPFDGLNPFIADEEVAVIKEVSAMAVYIEGKLGGTTTLFYWQEGVLTSKPIEVTIPETFNSLLTTPQFIANRPYFLYFFSNSSSFRQNTFYENASYTHNLNTLFPFSSGATVKTFGGFSHLSTGEKRLPPAGFIYQGRSVKLDLGQTSASLSQLLNRFTGYSLVGSKFEYKLPIRAKASHQIATFAGSVPPTDYFDATFNDQKLYGAHYSMMRSREDSLFADFINANFVSYGLENASSLRYAGVADGSLHISKNLSLGAGYAQDQGGFVTAFNPRLETGTGLTEAKYDFIKHGMQEFGDDVELEDTHEYAISSQYMLKDKATLVGGNISQEIVLPTATSTASKSNTLTGGLSWSRRLSFKKGYGVNYQFTRAVEDAEMTLRNSLGTSLSQPVSKSSYLFHNIGYSRSDVTQSTNAITVLSSFNTETERLRYSSILSTYLSRGSFDNESLSLSSIVEWNLKQAIISGNATYQKSSFRDGNHQVILAPAINYQPTTVDLFALNGGISFLVNAATQTTGSLGLQYQRLFGPGVVSDSLIKRLFKGGQKAAVEGDVFFDKNYNTILDENDMPLANIAVVLDGKKAAVTDDKGHYVFKKVKAGEHRLSLDNVALARREDINTQGLENVTDQTFASSGIYPTILPIPLRYKGAKLFYRFILDVNDNRTVDDDDRFVQIKKIWLQAPDGERREFSTVTRGSMIRGLKPGTHKVWIDFLDIPETVESLSPLTQSVTIKEYEEQELTYVFKPIRFLRGQIKTKTQPLPRGLKVRLGNLVSTVDSKGYYWLKNLKPGDFDLKLEGLPQKLCMEKDIQSKLSVPAESFLGAQDIFLTEECERP